MAIANRSLPDVGGGSRTAQAVIDLVQRQLSGCNDLLRAVCMLIDTNKTTVEELKDVQRANDESRVKCSKLEEECNELKVTLDKIKRENEVLIGENINLKARIGQLETIGMDPSPRLSVPPIDERVVDVISLDGHSDAPNEIASTSLMDYAICEDDLRRSSQHQLVKGADKLFAGRYDEALEQFDLMIFNLNSSMIFPPGELKELIGHAFRLKSIALTMRGGDDDNALECAIRSRQLMPLRYEPWTAIGVAQQARGKIEDSIHAFREAKRYCRDQDVVVSDIDEAIRELELHLATAKYATTLSKSAIAMMNVDDSQATEQESQTLSDRYRKLALGWTTDKLRQVLDLNGQTRRGKKHELVDRVVDGFVHGSLPRCKCGLSQVLYDDRDDMYRCGFYFNETLGKVVRGCDFQSAQVQRSPWKSGIE